MGEREEGKKEGGRQKRDLKITQRWDTLLRPRPFSHPQIVNTIICVCLVWMEPHAVALDVFELAVFLPQPLKCWMMAVRHCSPPSWKTFRCLGSWMRECECVCVCVGGGFPLGDGFEPTLQLRFC